MRFPTGKQQDDNTLTNLKQASFPSNQNKSVTDGYQKISVSIVSAPKSQEESNMDQWMDQLLEKLYDWIYDWMKISVNYKHFKNIS